MITHADCCTYHCTDAPGCPVHRPQRRPAATHQALLKHAEDMQAQHRRWAEVLAAPRPRIRWGLVLVLAELCLAAILLAAWLALKS